MDPQALVDQIDELIDAAIDRMLVEFGRAEGAALDELLARLQDLQIGTAGNIKPTKSNLREITRIIAAVRDQLFGKAWENGLVDLDQAITSISALINDYLTGIGSTVPQSVDVLIESAIAATRQTLSVSGIGGTVNARIDKLMRDAVTSGSTLRETIRAARELWQGGLLEQIGRVNTKQVATDALGQFSGNYFKQAAERNGLQWYRYVGGRIDTTREFCNARTGKYWHRDEIESWAGLNWDGKIVPTTQDTIFANRGGYNCRHQLLPVLASAVPASDRQRYREWRRARA